MSKSDIGKDPATASYELSLPLPEPIVLGSAETKAVAGGRISGGGGIGANCAACGGGQPLQLSLVNF